MTNEFGSPALDPRLELFGLEFSQLSPSDQALVLALVRRLRQLPGTQETEEYPKDVPFMDFDE